ncbi:ATP-dependent DNA ligase [Polychaeton citri CBS 116435]|uniref:DNA ligase n=1 Tax=Polychaeton citri CBS 116435 TaxID=1314669 RepID=A0A9P4UKN7_9PEZI|nr:ATP-dependent DNA ligase [Polychaeton citri CBS 116435]
MTLCAKRRKKNDYKPSPTTIRSLDFFFGKQNAKEKQQPAKESDDEDLYNVDDGSRRDINGTDRIQEHDLSDEQLARKLQAEWDEQDRLAGGGRDAIGSSSADGINHPEGRSEGEAKMVGDKLEEETLLPEVADTTASADRSKSTLSNNAFGALGSKNDTLSLQSATAEEDMTSYSIQLDQSPLTFDPQKYVSSLQSQWSSPSSNSKDATYALLTHTFVLVNQTQSRIKIVDTLVNCLRTIIEADPSSLLPAVWLATNSISPPYINLELGLGGGAISKALKKVCGLDNASLKTLYNKHGDAGDVAFEAKKRQSLTLRKPKPLTIKGVFDGLVKIANAKGHGCQEVKQRIVERLVQDARGAEESRYIVRTLVQHLRIGAVKTTMLIALSRAFLLSRPPGKEFPTRGRAQLSELSKQDLAEVYSPGEELVKACYARRPNYNDLVPTLLEIGLSDELLIRCGLALHIPLRPMLGGITRDLGEMLTKLQTRDFACEFKYDGQRAQVHCDSAGHVTIFSRHLEVMTEKYPDLVALVPQIRGEGVSSFIMEGEVVAVDRERGELKPFQILANRARKDVVIQSVKVDVCLFAFDLMYLNGEELLNRPFRERRNLLRSLFIEVPNRFTWVKSLDATSEDQETVSDFFKQAIDIKCEGIMVKVLDNLPNPDLLQADELDTETAQSSMFGKPTSAPNTPSKRKKSTSAKSKKAITIRHQSSDNPTATDDPNHPQPNTRRKPLLSTYEPDKRLDSWLKVKKDYNALSAETLDLIPVGGWHGQGRKNAWWSPILLALRNPDTGQLEVVSKCMSGFTDAFYKANRAKYDPATGKNTLPSKPGYVDYAGEPDVWFEPQEVWEMAFADVTISPVYTAAIGLVREDRGLSLRFPRFLKVREDKGLEEASEAAFLAELYWKQEARAPNDRGAGTSKVEAKEEDDEE